MSDLFISYAREDKPFVEKLVAALEPFHWSMPFHVDVLHVPHQGSDRNVSRRFFELVTADHYVIGGNGIHGNPESATLAMITEARRDAAYQLVFTHLDGREAMRKRLQGFFAEEQNAARKYQVVFRQQDSGSLKIHLLRSAQY